MQRHTFMTDGYYAINGEQNFEDQNENYCGAAIDKLATYENLEEDGRLVVLPCKIGDTIYIVNPYNNTVEEDTVMFFTVTQAGILPKLKYHNRKFWEHNKWFETVFLKYEDALAALNARN